MKNKIRMIILGAVLFSLVLMSQATVFSQTKEEDNGGRVSKMFEEGGKRWEKHQAFMEELGLTPEQQEQLKAHKKVHREQRKALRQTLKQAREELGAVLGEYEADPQKVESAASKVKNAQAQLIDHRIEGVLNVKQVLNAEQFARFQQKVKKMRGKRKERKKRFHQDMKDQYIQKNAEE